jgi:cell division protein FtsW (lipid II flippase)
MSSNNGQMDLLIQAITVALLVGMFTAGAFMIYESTSADDETKKTEPNKMYFGIVFMIMAAFFGIYFVYSAINTGKNAVRKLNANGYPI